MPPSGAGLPPKGGLQQVLAPEDEEQEKQKGMGRGGEVNWLRHPKRFVTWSKAVMYALMEGLPGLHVHFGENYFVERYVVQCGYTNTFPDR